MPRPMVSRTATAQERVEFWSTTIPETSCWYWMGRLDKDGYGQIGLPEKRTQRAYRVSFEAHRGEIPKGMVIDHLCRNRSCVNPAHLELVSGRENTLRGLSGRLKTHCPKGHSIANGDAYVVPATGKRSCKECRKQYGRAWRARQRETL